PSSHWSVVAILGILKAGGAYVPVDAETPVERVQYLIGDTQMKALIILSEEEEKAREYGVDTLVLDKEWEMLKALSPELNPETGAVH
ncbi:AMP-binding protein, partial [Salmonella enterica subsp. enterica]